MNKKETKTDSTKKTKKECAQLILFHVQIDALANSH